VETSTLLMMGVGLAVGGVAGAAAHAWWPQKNARNAPFPSKWPLTARGLFTTEEHEVLRWLRKTFPKHLVMVKLPLVRFTVPLDKEKSTRSRQLQALLEGVFCTFAVCSPSGTVLGCVDVPGKRGLPRGNRDLKEALLSDCAIAYTVVRGFNLPTAGAMRAAFLGELEEADMPAHQETRGGDSSFHADLDAFTAKTRSEAKKAALQALNRDSDAKRLPVTEISGFTSDGMAARGTGKSGQPAQSGRVSPEWEDSFIQPADSRPVKLDTH
jgi:hypothetical protein